MKFRAPMYYKDFHCIADKCKDSCCSAGWEIDIDAETEEFYKNVTGAFGDKLRSNITKTSPCHFVLDNHNNCPFLNDKKLCDIYINLGEEHLCQICKDHPRFYEWFDGIKEAGIGLCCEEAARIILSQNENFSVYEEEVNDECDESISYDYIDSDDYNSELYNYLISARAKIINYLDNSDISITCKLRNILWYGYTLQQDIDSELLDDEEIFDVSSDCDTNIGDIIEYISTLEPNDENWPNYLKKCTNLSGVFNQKLAEFENANPEVENYLRNISIYFIWRYFMKGVFDGDVLSKIKLMYVSCFVLRYLFFCKWVENGNLGLDDCIDIVKRYSEEVEYCEDNLVKFAGDSYEMDELETEYLLGL